MNFETSLILRLDLPEDGSTRHSNVIPIKGWFLHEEQSGKPLPEVEVVVEHLSGDKSVLAAGMLIAGVRLSEAIQIQKSEQSISSVDSKLKGSMFTFETELVLTSNAPKLLSITALARQGSQYSASNSSVVSTAEVADSSEMIAGFISPSVSFVESNNLIVTAWALRGEDRISSAVLLVNSKVVAKAGVALDSPAQRISLPDLEYSDRCGIASVVSIAELLDHEINVLKPLELSLKIQFESGHEAVLDGLGVLLKAPETKSICVLEKVSCPTGNKLTLGGYYVTDALVEPHLELQWLRGSERIDAASKRYREELALQYPHVDFGHSSGFEFSRNLGRLPGAISLRLSDSLGNSLVECAPRSLFKLGSVLCSQHQSFLLRALNYLARNAGAFRRLLARGSALSTGIESSVRGGEVVGAARDTVLVFTHNLSATEGAPKVLYDVVSYLDEKLKVLVLSPIEGDLREAFEGLGAEVLVVPELDGKGEATDVNRARRECLNIIRERRPTLLYANSIHGYLAIECAAREGLKAIWAIHESIDPFAFVLSLTEPLRYLFSSALQSGASFVFVSRATQTLFENRVPINSSRVIHNSVDVNEIKNVLTAKTKLEARDVLSISSTATVISVVGTTTQRKGQDVFLREMAELVSRNPEMEFEFLVVGARKNKFLDTLIELKSKLALTQLRFIEEASDISNYFLASDIMVVSSREESAPLVSLEAFAFRRPLISTSVFGLAEQVEDGENALAFELEVEGDLASKIETLLASDELCRKLVAGGERTLADKFSRERQISEYRELVNNIV